MSAIVGMMCYTQNITQRIEQQMAKLDEKRVEAFYEKLTGKKPAFGQWNVERRNFAQKIVYIEDACKSVLSAIRDLEQATIDDDLAALEHALRTEFKFLDTLHE